jgi:probable F420-dependent oxidoreductase
VDPHTNEIVTHGVVIAEALAPSGRIDHALTMQFGIGTPIVIQFPGTHAGWESTAGIDELDAVARAADRLGFHHLTCSEHVAIPEYIEPIRGATYWDPLATFGYMAAITETIRFATNVLVLGYHHPLAIAKRYGTLDVVSRGRLILGLGVGSLEEEFSLLGAEFQERGSRADDALLALRASLGRRVPDYHGPYYSYEGMVVAPHAVQSRIPFWIGGRTRRSLRRAVTLADGWMPFALSYGDVAGMLGDFDLPGGFDVILPGDRRIDPAEDPEGTLAAVESARRAGATMLNVAPVSRSLSHLIEQLEAFATLVGL